MTIRILVLLTTIVVNSFFIVTAAVPSFSGYEHVATRSKKYILGRASKNRRNIFRAFIDLKNNKLKITKSKAVNNSEDLKWTNEYDLNNAEDKKDAIKDLRKYQLNYNVESVLDLNPKNCSGVFFSLPVNTIASLNDDLSDIFQAYQAQESDVSSMDIIRFGLPEHSNKYILRAIFNKDRYLSKFSIASTDGSSVSDLKILQQSGQILITDQHNHVLARVKTDEVSPERGGKFSLIITKSDQLENPLNAEIENEDLESTKFDFMLEAKQSSSSEGKRTWKLTAFFENNGEINLNSDTNPDSDDDPAAQIAKAPIDLVSGLLDGFFGTLIWNIFWTKSGKKKEIEKRINERALENETLREYLTKDEIKEISKRVSREEGLPWFAPFSNTDNVAKKAMIEFSRAIVLKILQENGPDGLSEKELKDTTVSILSDFYKCLDRAGSDDEHETCLNKFSNSAPYRIGREILRLNLIKGLEGQNLSSEDFDSIMKVSDDQYKKCSQSHYFREIDVAIEEYEKEMEEYYNRRKNWRRNQRTRGVLAKRPKNMKEPEFSYDGTDDIKACLFTGVLAGTEKATRLIVNHNISGEHNTQEEYEAASTNILENAYKCAEEEHLFIHNENFREYFYDDLKSYEPDVFRQKMEKCVAVVKKVAGKDFIKGQVYNNPSVKALEEVRPGVSEEIYQASVQKGWDPCVELEAVQDPTSCEPLILSVATGKGAVYNLEDVINQTAGDNSESRNMMYSQLGINGQNVAPDGVDINQCFESNQAQILQQLSTSGTSSDQGEGDLSCLKRGIMAIIPGMSQIMLEKEFKTNPALKDSGISPDEELISSARSISQACFQSEIDKYSSIDDISSNMDKMKATCAGKVYKDVLPKIVRMILAKEVEGVIKDKNKVNQLLDELMADLEQLIGDEEDADKIMAAVEAFKPDATIKIMDAAVDYIVADSIKGSNANASEMIADVKSELLTEQVKQDVRDAYASGDDSRVAGVINSFKLSSGKAILSRVLPIKLGEQLQSKTVIRNVTRQVMRNYDRCTDDLNASSEQFGKEFEKCTNRAKNGATHSVMDILLTESLKKIFPPGSEKIKIVKEKLLKGDIWSKIDRANKSSNPNAVARMGELFKLEAAEEVARIVLKDKIAEKVTGSAANGIVSNSVQEMKNCLSTQEAKIKSEFNKSSPNITSLRTDQKIEECTKTVTIFATESVLKHLLAQNYGLLDGRADLTTPVLAQAMDSYRACSNAIPKNISEEDFNERALECNAKTIFVFSKLLGEKTIQFLSPVLSTTSNVTGSFNTCVNEVESNFRAAVHDEDWAQKEVNKCVENQLKPKLFSSFRTKVVGSTSQQLNGTQKRAMESFVNSISPVLSINIKSSGSSSGNSNIMAQASEVIPMLADVAAVSAKYDSAETTQRANRLKNKLNQLKNSGGEVSAKQLLDTIVDSDLMTTVIKSQVANKIENDWGLGVVANWLLTNPDRLNNILENTPEGKAFVRGIKNDIKSSGNINTDQIVYRVVVNIEDYIERKKDEATAFLSSLNPF